MESIVENFMALIPYAETRLQFVVMGHVMDNKVSEVGFSEKFIDNGGEAWSPSPGSHEYKKP